jgi:hypothetical protein
MTGIAKVSSAKAAEEGYGAAELAFPVDLFNAVLLAGSLTGSNILEDAVLAEKFFLCRLALLSHLLLTIDKATEVRLLATVALVEGAAAVGEFLRLAVIDVILSCEPLIAEETLPLGVRERLLLNALFEREERTELTSNGLGQAQNVDLLFAAGAVHEGESNSEGGPLVLEELNDAVCVEDMATRELGACFGSKLSSVANCA